MSRVEDRLRRDLRQIADRATPSPTAWEAIRTRIDSQEPAEEMEIIMLTDDQPTNRRWLAVGLAAAAAIVALVVGVAIATRDDDTEVSTAPSATEVSTAPSATEVSTAPSGTEVSTATSATEVTTASGATPMDALDAYIAAFNADDLDAVMALFADDALILNDPVSGNMVAQGIDEVREVQEAEMSFGESYEVTSVDSVGNTVTADVLYQTTSAGVCYEGTIEITVEQGKIVRWNNLAAGRNAAGRCRTASSQDTAD
jgi:ketosteroid isomerase-like protein